VLKIRPVQLNADLAKLQRQYRDKCPDVISVKHEIKPRPKPGATPSDPANADIAALKAEDERLRPSRIETAPAREQELQQLSRDYRATREAHAPGCRRRRHRPLSDRAADADRIPRTPLCT